jgi:hypothetical protein
MGNSLQCRRVMKNNLFTTVLSWLLAASVILSIVFFLQFSMRTRDLRRFQTELAIYQQRRQVLNMMLTDLAGYSQRDAGIIPILQSLGIRATTNAPVAAPAAPAKPSAK